MTEKNTSCADALKETARFAIFVNPLETLYDYERWAIRILLVVLLLFGIGIAGHTLDVENPLSEAVYTYFLDSILNESSGDSGYNYVNTASYGIGLALFVVSLSGLLRVAGIDGSDAMLIALLKEAEQLEAAQAKARKATIAARGRRPAVEDPGVPQGTQGTPGYPMGPRGPQGTPGDPGRRFKS